MARPKKIGLDYFPMDVDMDQDDKIYLVKAEYGWEGFAIVVKLLMEIYSEGYFLEWDERKTKIFSRKNLFNLDVVNGVINVCLDEDLFAKTSFEEHGILTSKGIQTRYLEATTRRREIILIKEFLLIDVNADNNSKVKVVNVDINSQSSEAKGDGNPQSKVKESKVKESKVNQTTTEEKHVVDDAPKNNEMYDKDFAKITQFYQENIGPLVPHIGEELGYMIDAHPVELILEAFKRALEANASNKVRYVNSILINWKHQLLKTLDEVNAADQRRVNSFSNKKVTKIELVPDWFGKSDKPTVPIKENSDIAVERERLRQELLGG